MSTMEGLKRRLSENFDVPKYGTSIGWNDTLYVAVYDNSNTCKRCRLDTVDIYNECNACNANPNLTYVWVRDTNF